jgi:hypothetical protein
VDADVNREEAEEYTQALGQVVAGGWRQVALGKRLGVPQALGISVSEWVENRLGGYIRLSIPDRREAVKELTAPVEDGGQGMSTRQAAEILGESDTTVWRDMQPASNEATVNLDRVSTAPEAASSEAVDLLADIIEASGQKHEIENEFVRSEYFSWIVSARRIFHLSAERVGEVLSVPEQEQARQLQQEMNDWFDTCTSSPKLRRLV